MLDEKQKTIIYTLCFYISPMYKLRTDDIGIKFILTGVRSSSASQRSMASRQTRMKSEVSASVPLVISSSSSKSFSCVSSIRRVRCTARRRRAR